MLLKSCVPASVPGIAFLSGGQSDEEATAHLDAMNRIGGLPWPLTFSYGRALQHAPQTVWSGKPENVAAALLRLAAADERTLINRVKVLAPIVQSKDAALLIAGHAEIAARAAADGAHLTGIDALQAALGSLKPARIAGCGGLATRHDAMLAGEAGTDYVMFGEPDERNH